MLINIESPFVFNLHDVENDDLCQFMLKFREIGQFKKNEIFYREPDGNAIFHYLEVLWSLDFATFIELKDETTDLKKFRSNPSCLIERKLSP